MKILFEQVKRRVGGYRRPDEMAWMHIRGELVYLIQCLRLSFGSRGSSVCVANAVSDTQNDGMAYLKMEF